MVLDQVLQTGLISLVTTIIAVPGTLLATRNAQRIERRKKVRASIEEIYELSNQVHIWVHVTIRQIAKSYEWDYFHESIPAEYLLGEATKEPAYPVDRLQMLIDFDATSLKSLLPVYTSIVSLLRDIKYIHDVHKSADTLDYYLSGVIFDKVEKIVEEETESGSQLLYRLAERFDALHTTLLESLSKIAQKN